MRIVFFGTPDFASASLSALVDHGHHVVAVVTATDKLGGRGGKKVLQSDVKRLASELDIPVLQPPNLKNPTFVASLEALKADIFIVVAFRMLPEVVWSMPRLGTMNIHGSLLPKYRGAAPINWAIIRGEKETGVTSFFLKHAIDTGQIFETLLTPIGPDQTFGEVYDQLKVLGGQVLLNSLKRIQKGDIYAIDQDESLVSHAPKIFHDDCQIDFTMSAKQIHDFVRGLSPWPCAWTMLNGEKCKVYRTSYEQLEHRHDIGCIIKTKNSFSIAVEDGLVHFLDIQLQKRKRMDIKSFLNGWKGGVSIVGK